MRGLPRRRIAMGLLLAAFAQPGQALAHAAVHEHLAQHHGEAPPVGAPDPYESGTQQISSAERSHDHEHDHPDIVFLRPTRGTDLPSPAALSSPTPCPYVVVTRQRRIHRDAAPSRASPEASGPSDPRAPPIV